MMRNGADKTTTVRILATLISPTVGSALVAGIPVGPEGAAEIRKRIAVMHGLIAGLGDRGVTVFLATRRLEEAKRLCDRVGHHENQSVDDRQA